MTRALSFFSEICIYVRKSCKCGPFLKQAKVASIPSVIGPANPNSVLRQLVKQVVLSAHSSKVVLKLLASETDKMTISSIIRVGCFLVYYPAREALLWIKEKSILLQLTLLSQINVLSADSKDQVVPV